MGYSSSHLYNEEEIVLDLRPHWWFFARQVVVLTATVAVGVLVLALGGPEELSLVVGIVIVVALAWFGLRFVVWATTNFVITTDRLIERHGVLSRQGIEIPLERVNTVFFRQSLFERMIRSGDLVVESAGEMGSQRFTDIRRPLNVQNEIYRQMEANETRKHQRAFGMVPTAEPSIPDQIDKLHELLQRGALTFEEFEDKKAELLRRL